MEQIIIQIIKLFLPRLKELASQSDNKMDDLVVGILDALLGEKV